jgi:hypothetical protein
MYASNMMVNSFFISFKCSDFDKLTDRKCQSEALELPLSHLSYPIQEGRGRKEGMRVDIEYFQDIMTR